jgi:hypothetical protein
MCFLQLTHSREPQLADVTAMIFWLKNRRPAQWRDVQKVDHAVRLRTPQEILEDLRQDMIAMGLLPAPTLSIENKMARLVAAAPAGALFWSGVQAARPGVLFDGRNYGEPGSISLL